MSKTIPLISVEQFALYLDGKISPDEMKHIGELTLQDDMLNEIMEVSNRSDEIQSEFDASSSLPDEISNLDFDLPTIEVDFSQSNPFDVTYYDDAVAAICADDVSIDCLNDLIETDDITADEHLLDTTCEDDHNLSSLNDPNGESIDDIINLIDDYTI